MLQIISLVLENKPGALMRVTGLLSQCGYNIESLTVARTLDPELSRMTIVVDVEATQRQQVIKQMNKLINVLQATDLTESPAVVRELVLVRIRTPQESRTAVLKEAEIFGGHVVDSSTEGYAIEVTGDPENRSLGGCRSYRPCLGPHLAMQPRKTARPHRSGQDTSRTSFLTSSAVQPGVTVTTG